MVPRPEGQLVGAAGWLRLHTADLRGSLTRPPCPPGSPSDLAPALRDSHWSPFYTNGASPAGLGRALRGQRWDQSLSLRRLLLKDTISCPPGGPTLTRAPGVSRRPLTPRHPSSFCKLPSASRKPPYLHLPCAPSPPWAQTPDPYALNTPAQWGPSLFLDNSSPTPVPTSHHPWEVWSTASPAQDQPQSHVQPPQGPSTAADLATHTPSWDSHPHPPVTHLQRPPGLPLSLQPPSPWPSQGPGRCPACPPPKTDHVPADPGEWEGPPLLGNSHRCQDACPPSPHACVRLSGPLYPGSPGCGDPSAAASDWPPLQLSLATSRPRLHPSRWTIAWPAPWSHRPVQAAFLPCPPPLWDSSIRPLSALNWSIF